MSVVCDLGVRLDSVDMSSTAHCARLTRSTRRRSGFDAAGLLQRRSSRSASLSARQSAVQSAINLLHVSSAEHAVVTTSLLCSSGCTGCVFHSGCVLTYCCLHGLGPDYFARVTFSVSRQPVASVSATTDALLVPATRHSTLGDRSFQVAATRAWNLSPGAVTSAPTIPVFRRLLIGLTCFLLPICFMLTTTAHNLFCLFLYGVSE